MPVADGSSKSRGAGRGSNRARGDDPRGRGGRPRGRGHSARGRGRGRGTQRGQARSGQNTVQRQPQPRPQSPGHRTCYKLKSDTLPLPAMAARIIKDVKQVANVEEILFDPETRLFSIVSNSHDKQKAEDQLKEIVLVKAMQDESSFIPTTDKRFREPCLGDYEEVFYPPIFLRHSVRGMVDLRPLNPRLTYMEMMESIGRPITADCNDLVDISDCIVSCNWPGTIIYVAGWTRDDVELMLRTLRMFAGNLIENHRGSVRLYCSGAELEEKEEKDWRPPVHAQHDLLTGSPHENDAAGADLPVVNLPYPNNLLD